MLTEMQYISQPIQLGQLGVSTGHVQHDTQTKGFVSNLGKPWRKDSGKTIAGLLACHPPQLHIQLVLLPKGGALLQPLRLCLY